VRNPRGVRRVQRGRLHHLCYTTSNHRRKTRVLLLVKNDLTVRANVKVRADIMDPAVQSVWLHFNHHSIGSATQGATLGAFVLGGIYREWTPLLSREESRLRLGLLSPRSARPRNTDPESSSTGTSMSTWTGGRTKGNYMATLAKSLAECTSTAGLETHATAPTFRSFGNFIPRPAGDFSRPPGDVARHRGDAPSPATVCLKAE
jgi:hypothetical protein